MGFVWRGYLILSFNIVKMAKKIQEAITSKVKIAQGLEHDIYPTRDPNKVIKVGETKYVNKWVKDFKSRPDLFPVIYNVKPFRDNPKLSYVEMERLDTEQFEVDYDVLKEILSENTHWDVLEAIEAGERKEEVFNWIYNKIKEQDKEIADFYIKLYNNVIETKQFKKGWFDVYDFHKGQFGYDKQHNVKMLDY
jgi:hypothetical protein